MNKMNFSLGLAIICVTLSASFADDFNLPTSLTSDLDRDGELEKIVWPKFAEDEEGEFYQLKVLDDDGSLLWEGPKLVDAENPLVFGNWSFGYSVPELVGDIDADGAIEIVAPDPQSDISPRGYRVLRWKDDRFSVVRSGCLMRSRSQPEQFSWSRADASQGSWISSFEEMLKDGSLRCEVFEYIGGKTPRMGEAIVTPTPKGYEVKRWTQSLKALTDMPSPEPSEPAVAGGVIVYRTWLGAGDHFNSAGRRLEKVGDILRQDRANYYKGSGDEADGPDPVFRTSRSRETMGARKLIPVGISEAALQDAIVNGTPMVEVEVAEDALRVKLVE